MKDVRMLIVHLRKSFRARACEWFLAIVVLGWGIILVQPGETFNNSPVYDELGRWAEEGSWAWFCLVGGGTRVLALFINGAARPSPHVRAALAMLSAFFFAQISIGILLAGGAPSTGLAVYLPAVFFELYNAARAAEDAAEVDRKARNAGVAS